MNKKEFNYVSPTAIVKEMQAEGVLCMSFMQQQTLSIQEWKVDEDFSW